MTTTIPASEQMGQPWIYQQQVIVSAPAQLWSAAGGRVDGSGASGFYVGDTRVISALQLKINGVEPELVRSTRSGADRTENVYLARNITGATVDPMVRVNERRVVDHDSLSLEACVVNGLDRDVRMTVEMSVYLDDSDMQSIKGGAAGDGQDRPGGLRISLGRSGVEAHSRSGRTVVTPHAGAAITRHGTRCSFAWEMTVPAHGNRDVGFVCSVEAPQNVVVAAKGEAPWSGVHLDSGDPRLDAWVKRSLQDLAGLRMSVPDMPEDEFLAAGAPWFFTLFGRDSLWAARFLLPLTDKPAIGTLRILARFQASTHDPHTNAEPGKIPHELRSETLESSGAFSSSHMRLPPLYYGTVDATALWVILLGELARGGVSPSVVEELIPNLERALAWIVEWGDADDDGFLEYIDRSGHGLSNQGWKDSGDSVRWRDGSIAEGPIALCEVQAYAYQAAIEGAGILDDFGRPGAPALRTWAAGLKSRFNQCFWAHDEMGRYPVIALDGQKRQVDSVTSNIGHLLGTGILDEDGARDVAHRLMSPQLNSGYGIRTLSRDSGGYWPLSYHCGSVWAHDSAIAMLGLSHEGFVNEAKEIANGLIEAAASFGYQMPELYSGDAAPESPVPYPAACHPQAWSAAAAIVVFSVVNDLSSQQGDTALLP